MLQNIKSLHGQKLSARDGEITRISHEDSKVHVNLTLADLKATGRNEVAVVGGSDPTAIFIQR